MSALGHKRTWRLQFAMSALHSIADIHCGNRNVSFGPTADIEESGTHQKKIVLGDRRLDRSHLPGVKTCRPRPRELH
jgi:hypothetical protein